jgi:acyl-coenzyme A thioesterase PaaI-like protein
LTHSDTAKDSRQGGHILSELGFGLARVGDELHGSAVVVPGLFAPQTRCLRLSVLATWADAAAGHAVMAAFAPRVPVTLDLDVHAYRPLQDLETVSGVARLIKSGRSVAVVTVTFSSDGAVVAVATASFMASPDPGFAILPEHADLSGQARAHRPLQLPLAERARCRISEPGVAMLPRSEDGLNASGTVSGGLIALAIEEAALSLTPGATLASLSMRYLRPVRTGPAIATATLDSGLATIHVHDQDRLSVFAITRTFLP